MKQQDAKPMPGQTGMDFLLHRELEKGLGERRSERCAPFGLPPSFRGEERDGDENAHERKREDFEKAIDAAPEAGYNRDDK